MEQALWYYVDAERQRHGPVPATTVRERFAAGQLTLRSLVWRQGLPQWQAIEQLADELGLTPAPDAATRVLHRDPPPPPPPALAAHSVDPAAAPPRQRDDALAQAYAAHLGSDPQARHGTHHGGPVVDAGFLKRVAAHVIDGVILGFAGGVIGGLLGVIFGVALVGSGADPFAGSLLMNVINFGVGIVLGLLYYAGFHASSSQATPGKLLVGIKVARSNGERLTPLRAGTRLFATYVNLLTLGIGWLMAAFTTRKQALHDLLCDTVVVDRWAYTEFPERQNEALGGCAIAVLVLVGLFILLGVGGALIAITALSSSGAWH